MIGFTFFRFCVHCVYFFRCFIIRIVFVVFGESFLLYKTLNPFFLLCFCCFSVWERKEKNTSFNQDASKTMYASIHCCYCGLYTFIPCFCETLLTWMCSWQISGIVYGILMGALTGYFSIVVGSLFSIAGVVGIAAAAFHGRKAIATLVCFLSFIRHLLIC